jgi:hypothetical protein
LLEFDRVVPIGRERDSLLTARVTSGEVILFEHDGLMSGYAVIRSQTFCGRDFVELLAVATSGRRYWSRRSLTQRSRGCVVNTSELHLDQPVEHSNDPLARGGNWQFSSRLERIEEGDTEDLLPSSGLNSLAE